MPTTLLENHEHVPSKIIQTPKIQLKLDQLPANIILIPRSSVPKSRHNASWWRIRRWSNGGKRQRNRVRREQDRRCPRRRLRRKFSPSSSVTPCANPLLLFQEPVSSGVDRSGKAAPLPDGISEMKDAPGSGGGSQGVTPGGGEKTTGGGSGKGGN